MGPGPENTAGGRDGPIEMWSVQNSWVGWGGPRSRKLLGPVGAGTGPIEKWSRTPQWGGVGPGPENTAWGRDGPIEKRPSTPTLYTTVFPSVANYK